MRATQDSLAHRAQMCLPGGVGAAARCERYFGTGFFVSGGEGPYLTDSEGRPYIDLNTGNGASLLGNAPGEIRAAVQDGLGRGLVCGYDVEAALDVAEGLARLFPGIDKVRFCGSGTEATHHAVRLARGITGRPLVLKIEGHFHGVSDSLGYGLRPAVDGPEADPSCCPLPQSAGIPEAVAALTRVVPFNDLDAVDRAFALYPGAVAALILEPVNYNAGTLLPGPGYLEGLRERTRQAGALLIFDEILSGFSLGPGGMQTHAGVTPDLCTLGKALGGGLPLSAVGGAAALMDHFAPAGPVSHTGTFVGSPLVMHAARAFLHTISGPGFFDRLEAAAQTLHEGLVALFQRHGTPIRVRRKGARFSLLFGPSLPPVPRQYRDVARQDHALARAFYAASRDHGVYFKPGWHHGISAAHDGAVIDEALARLEAAVQSLGCFQREKQDQGEHADA